MNHFKAFVQIFVTSYCCFYLSYSLPTIDPGVFVLQGVPTCRQGKGYCVLGTNCSIDKDFAFDNEGGNCNEVTKSFTSLLSFVCCRFVRDRQEEDVYQTTVLPFTIMEEKFQVLDQNPIPIDENYDSEISEDEDLENLVDIVGVVTDMTGIISLVTRPYQPPSKSTTSVTTVSTISNQDMSSTEKADPVLTKISTKPTLNEEIIPLDTVQELDPQIFIEESNLTTHQPIQTVITKESNVTVKQESSDQTKFEDTIFTAISNLTDALKDPVNQSSSLGNSSELPEAVYLNYFTSLKEAFLKSSENQQANKAMVSLPDVNLSISSADTEHIINSLIISLTDKAPTLKPNELSVSSVSQDTVRTDSEVLKAANDSLPESSNDSESGANSTESYTSTTEIISTTAYTTTTDGHTSATTLTTLSVPDDIISTTPLTTTFITKDKSDNESNFITQDPNNKEQNKDKNYQSTPPPEIYESSVTEPSASVHSTNFSSNPSNKETVVTTGIEVVATTVPNEIVSSVISQKKETQEPSRNAVLVNQVQVLNLPEEIRNYLARKQVEKLQKEEKLKILLSNKRDEPVDNELSTTSKPHTTITTTATTLTVTSASVDDATSAPPLAVTEVIENIVSTEKSSNLKPNPLIPLYRDNHQENKKQENQNTDTTIRYSTEDGNGWKGQDEFVVTTTYQTTLLQKFHGPNIIELGTENRGDIKEESDERIVPHPINLNICGLRTPNLMLSEQARAASTYDWCWSAALMRKEGKIDRFECSGTLVELDLVVTTAACLKRLRSKDLANYRVVLGDSNLRDELPYGVQYLDIDEIVTHPDYLTLGGAHANDIGIIRLRDIAILDHNVCLACISQRNAFIPSHTCVVSGYTLGNIPQDIRRDVEGFTPMEGILRESLVNLQKSSDCEDLVKRLAPSPLLVADQESFLCDVKRKSARTCTNTLDGGSPLVCEVGGRWFLTGIASWSRDCSSDPNIYTRVSSFSDWFLNTRLRMYGFVSHRL